MPTNTIFGIRIAGVASAVPSAIRRHSDEFETFGELEVLRIIDKIGVSVRHVAGALCTSDLCASAAERLIEEIGWPLDSVDALIFVTQTPDYPIPATACTLQSRLRLSRRCAAFDVNLGCSGYTYGLWLASTILASGNKRVLLLVGDTISRIISPKDRSVALLFGDAGTATALEYDGAASPMHFELGTDGSGSEHLMVRAGGHRCPREQATSVRTVRENGNIRSDEDLYMNAGEIFPFTLATVPKLIQSVLRQADWNLDCVDGFVFHQANGFMLQHLAKCLKVPPAKLVLALDQYGNTSSASIPLAVTTCLRNRLRSEALKLVFAGFGVGFSWGAAALSCGPIVMPELIEVATPASTSA